MANCTEENIVKFLNVLATHLLENATHIKDDDIMELLSLSVERLPECPLRDHLQQDISTHCDLLKNYLDEAAKPVKPVQSTGNDITDMSFGVKGIKATLQSIKDKQENNENKDDINNQYKRLLISHVWNDDFHLDSMLHQWADYLLSSCSYDEVISSVDSTLVHLSKGHFLFSSLKFHVKLMVHLMGTSPVNLINDLFTFLLTIHFAYQSIRQVSRDQQRNYDDHCVTLLAIFIKLHVFHKHDDGPALSLLCNTLSTVAGEEVILRSILQLHVDDGLCDNNEVTIKIIRFVMSRISLSSSLIIHPSLYLSCLCVVHFTSCEKGSCFVQQFDSISIPSSLVQWLYQSSPSVCQCLGVSSGWSAHQLQRHLIHNLNETQQKTLINLIACGGEDVSIFPSTTTTNTTSPVLVYDEDVHHISSTSVYYVDTCGNIDENMSLSNDQAFQGMMDYIVIMCDSCTESPLEVGEDESCETSSLPKIKQSSDPVVSAGAMGGVTPVSDATKISVKTSSSKRKNKLLKNLRKSLTPTKRSLPRISPKLLRSAAKKRGLVLNDFGEFI